MKKNKEKAQAKASKKAIKKELNNELVIQIQNVVSKFDQGSKKITKEIEKAADKLAKKITENIKIGKSVIAEEINPVDSVSADPAAAPQKRVRTKSPAKPVASSVETETAQLVAEPVPDADKVL